MGFAGGDLHRDVRAVVVVEVHALATYVCVFYAAVPSWFRTLCDALGEFELKTPHDQNKPARGLAAAGCLGSSGVA